MPDETQTGASPISITLNLKNGLLIEEHEPPGQDPGSGKGDTLTPPLQEATVSKLEGPGLSLSVNTLRDVALNFRPNPEGQFTLEISAREIEGLKAYTPSSDHQEPLEDLGPELQKSGSE